MARPNRSDIVFPGRPHHVIFRGNNRRRLCSYPTCYMNLIGALARNAERHDCEIHAGQLISNHGHLVVTPHSVEGLSKLMHAALQKHAVYRNRLRDGSGKVFEERFKSIVVRDTAHEARLYAYIDLNAVKAGIVAHPSQYPWGTYRLLSGEAHRSKVPSWFITPSRFWLELGEDQATRARVYRDHVEQHVTSPLALLDDEEDRELILAMESASEPYTRRLERPDRSCVREHVAGAPGRIGIPGGFRGWRRDR